MMRIAKALSMVGALALAASTAGCFVTTTDDSTSYALGTLTVDYTIAGSTDYVLCDSYGVTDVELIIYSGRGDQIDTLYAPCDAFRVGGSIDPGLYSADVTLVNSANQAMSVTKPLDALRVLADTELVVDVDFPPDSML